VASSLSFVKFYLLKLNKNYEFLLFFQRWSAEVPWLIADSSGLIFDLALMVQGILLFEANLSTKRCLYRLCCTDHARARSTAASRWR
jgi:hypothetical protein